MHRFRVWWLLGSTLFALAALGVCGEDSEAEGEDLLDIRIHGRVLTSEGNPLDGVTVQLDTPISEDGPIRMVTDLQGRYETEFSVFVDGPLHLRGTLVAKKAGYREGRELLDLEIDGEPDDIDIVLRTPDEDPDLLPMDALVRQLGPRLKIDAAARHPKEAGSDEFLRGCEELIEKRNAVDAVSRLQTAADRTPECLECGLLLSLALLDAGSWTGANNRLVEAIEVNAASDAPRPEPDGILGVLRSWRGHVKDAVASYLRALEFDPNHALFLQELGRMLVVQKNWEAADPYLERAIQAGADRVAHVLRARALLELGDAGEASREMDLYVAERKVKDLPVEARRLHSLVNSRLMLISQDQVRSMIAQTPQELMAALPELSGLEVASDQGMLDGIMEKAGERVEAFFHNLTNTASLEQVHQERVGKNGQVRDSLDQQFQYIMLADAESGGLGVEEYRSNEYGRDTSMGGLKHGFMLTSGFASVPSLFHPANRSKSEFRYLGMQEKDGRRTHVVAFSQKPETARVMTRFITDRGSALVLVHGMAWIDAESFHVIRIHTHLLNPYPRVRLQKLSTEIRLHGVEFAGIDEPLWLPEQVGISVDWRGRLLRNHHRYSDFKIFNVESRDEKKKLTEKDEQRLKEMSAGLPADSASEAPAEPPAEPPAGLR
jgi:Flp pilus assembly protein TadD